MKSEVPENGVWDVIVIGGALAGSSTALQLLRAKPELRVLILEKSTRFTRKVGEATVEISAFFLGRVLGLTRHLNEAHLVKQGMRFWFTNNTASTLADCGEIGGRYQVRLPAYQLDRAVIDEEVIRLARDAGAHVLRGAKVGRVSLKSGGTQQVSYENEAGKQTANARWVVDASGFAALLSRQEGWHVPNTEHPTSAVWARWRGVKDLDGLELATKFPEWASASYGIRSTATNHLMGDGWWAWIIPLKGGDVSIGLVYDQRHVQFPKEGSLGDRLKRFLSVHPVGAELLEHAEWVEGDVLARSNPAYSSKRYFGDGFVLVGDAGAFIDPFYSPGMDWLSFTSTAAKQIILKERSGEAFADLVARLDRNFVKSYGRWFAAVYKDKYDYMGELDLMRTAFRLDLGLYYLGVVSQPFKRGAESLSECVFTTPPSVPVFHLMCCYNRRLAAIARSRRQRGALGRTNARQRFFFGGFTLEPSSSWPVVKALGGWLKVELTEGWRSWLGSQPTSRKAEPSRNRAGGLESAPINPAKAA